MFYPAKNQKKFKYLMSLLGLMTIISMVITPTLKVQALDNQETLMPVSSSVPETDDFSGDMASSTPTSEEVIAKSTDENGFDFQDELPSSTPENIISGVEALTPTFEETEEPTEEIPTGEVEGTEEPTEETPTGEAEETEEPTGETPTEEAEPSETPEPSRDVNNEPTPTEDSDRWGSGATCDKDPYCHKIDPGTNSGSYTAPGPIVTFSVKSAWNLISYSPPGYSTHPFGYCWNVAITGSTVSWSRTQSNQYCQDPSHLEIKWKDAPEPDPISASSVCLQNGDHRITVTSASSQSIGYSWYSSNGDSGWGSVSSSNPSTFTTDHSAQTITIYYDYKSKSINTSIRVEACAQAADLTMSYECQDDARHLWTVSNSNDFDIAYTWSSTTGESGTGSVPANGTDTFLTNNQSQRVTIKYTFPDKARCGGSKCGPSDEKKLTVRAEKCSLPVYDLGLSYECLDDADHKWTVTNSNSFDLSYSWSSTTGEYGWGTVSANSTDNFYTNNAAQTVTIRYSFPAETRCSGCTPPEESVSVTAEACSVKYSDLSLSYECLDDADHKWTVTNTNSFDLSYSWSSTTGEYGQGRVSANSTDNFYTNNASQTVTIQYTFPEAARCGGCTPPEESVSATAEACSVNYADLGLTYECLDDGSHKWTVTNNNDLSFDYYWSSDADWQYGNGTVPANGSDVFYTNNKAQTVTILYNFPSADRMVHFDRHLSVTAEVCSLPSLLELSVQCLPGGDHQWTVTNNNISSITFNWASNNGVDSGIGLSVNGNGGTQTFTSNYEAQEVTLTYDYAGSTGIQVSKATEEVCYVPKDLQISVNCLTNSDHRWTVTNNNPDSITFAWESDNGVDFGSGLVVAGNGGTQTFTSNSAAQTITLTYDYAGQTGRKVVSDAAQVCGQPSDLTLEYECLDNGQHKWTVSNLNDFAIDFNWSSDVDSQYGNGTVAASGEATFYTNNKDQTVTLSYNFPAIVRMVAYDRSVSVHAEVCALPQKLQLSVECLVNGDHQWTVTNNNAKAITFDWASDNSIDSGTGPLSWRQRRHTNLYLQLRSSGSHTDL